MRLAARARALAIRSTRASSARCPSPRSNARRARAETRTNASRVVAGGVARASSPSRVVAASVGTVRAIGHASRTSRFVTVAANARNASEEEDEEEEEEDDEDEVLDEDFDVEEEVSAEDEASEGGAIDTAGTAYGELALNALRRALDAEPFAGDYEVHSFKVNTSRRRVLASVDKLSDKYGSPTLDELTAIVRAHNAILDERGFPEDVAVELASPGATRTLRVPRELARFRELVMDVTYKGEAENPESKTTVTKVMEITDITDSEVEWKLADVPANRPAKKGMGMNKKSREWRLRMPLDAVIKASLFIDI